MNSSVVALVEQVDTLLDDAAHCPTNGPSIELSVDVSGHPDDDFLRRVLVGLEQVINRAQALQAEAMVQMGARARAADQIEVEATGQRLWSRECREEFVPDEIAVLLGCTKVAAATRYDTACRATDLPAVNRAWLAGRIDSRKVAVIGEQVALLDTDLAHELAAVAVDYAAASAGQQGGGRTAPQLREWLRRRVIAAEPQAAEVRRQRAMADRRVVITPGDDGMSELWALLPSVQARQIQQILTKVAQEDSAGDARSMDQRRADTLIDLLLGRADPPAVNVQVIVSADTLTAKSSEPGWVPGLGPITAEQVSELLGTGAPDTDAPGPAPRLGDHVTFRRLLTDPSTGILTDVAERQYRPSAALDRAVRARDVTCRFPGCRRSANSAGTDLDHTLSWPHGTTEAANLAVLCRRHHRLKHTAGWNVHLDPTGTMTWTTPTGRRYRTDPWQYTDPDPPPLV